MIIASVAAALLVVPFAVPQSKPAPLVGPDLSDFRYEDVRFSNGEISLAGLLFLPDGAGPHLAAVFKHGSGTSRRNNPWYLTFGRHLRNSGVAVLLPDKRGSEASGVDWRDTWHATAGCDPIPYWERIDLPAFAALGGNDTNVSAGESVARFQAVPHDIQVLVYPDGGHGMTDLATGRVKRALVDDRVTFIRSATGSP